MNAPAPTHIIDHPAHEHPIPDRHGANAYLDDPAFEQLLKIYIPNDLLAHLDEPLRRLGELVGGPLDELAQSADRNPPTLEHRTRTGIDQQRIIKHPDYIAMEQLAFGEFGLAAMSHRAGVMGWPAPMPATVKYALTYLFVQAEFGLCCPVSMTDSLTRTLKKFGDAALVSRYIDDLTTQDLDALSQGAMFMTEQGAGSDVSATETLARPDDPESGQVWRLYGDKWFCSNPDAALAMVLARTENGPPGMKGVSLFLLPRTLPDGTPNNYRIIRLKDKLGTRSMASGEIRLEGARGWVVGELGRGFAQMADMVNNSRLSNGMRAAGLMRRAVAEALHVSHHRVAFGKRLVDMPLMQRQLAKLMVRAEQARTMMFQTAQALGRSDAGEPGAYALTRLFTPLIKFRACRDARQVTGDAMEVRGGCGYIEQWADARLVRDAHLGSIWEGTSNIVALDVLRAIVREDALPVWYTHVHDLLSDSPWQPGIHHKLEALIEQSMALAAQAAQQKNEAMARQVASVLYHLTTVIAMGWEAGQAGSKRRMMLAQLGLRHRLLSRSPLDNDATIDLSPLFASEATTTTWQGLEEMNLLD